MLLARQSSRCGMPEVRFGLPFATLIGIVVLVVPLVRELLHEFPSELITADDVLLVKAHHRLPQGPLREGGARVGAGVR